MLDTTEAAIIAWLRPIILDRRERADHVPDGPWAIHDDLHEIISADTGKATAAGFPQTIKAAVDGLNAHAQPTICETYDSPGQPLVVGPYLVMVSDPLHVRAMAESWLGALALVHRVLEADTSGIESRDLARQWLRLLAAAFNNQPGYDPAWAPDGNPQIGGQRPVVQADIDRLWPDAVPAGRQPGS